MQNIIFYKDSHKTKSGNKRAKVLNSGLLQFIGCTHNFFLRILLRLLSKSNNASSVQ